MFSLAGVPKDVALSLSLVYLSVIYLVSLIGGLFLIMRTMKVYHVTEIKEIFIKTGNKRKDQNTEKPPGNDSDK